VSRPEARSPEQASATEQADGTEQAGGTDAQTPAPRSQAAPAPVLPAVSSKPGGSKHIQLEFSQLAWVEIKQANGKILLSQLNPAGSKQSLDGTPPFALVIGNAANVRLIYNDEPVDLRPYFKVDVARLTLE
jgi:cytoskeleton protein RodZ